MNLKIGDIWNEQNNFDYLCVTTNSEILGPENRLVMGAGFAKQVLEKYPGVDFYLGNKIVKLRQQAYGIVVTSKFFPVTIVAFQTKIHWKDDARLDLIGYSTIKLLRLLDKEKPHRVDMVYPGIGKGKLHPDLVQPCLTYLPHKVRIWRSE